MILLILKHLFPLSQVLSRAYIPICNTITSGQLHQLHLTSIFITGFSSCPNSVRFSILHWVIHKTYSNLIIPKIISAVMAGMYFSQFALMGFFKMRIFRNCSASIPPSFFKSEEIRINEIASLIMCSLFCRWDIIHGKELKISLVVFVRAVMVASDDPFFVHVSRLDRLSGLSLSPKRFLASLIREL